MSINNWLMIHGTSAKVQNLKNVSNLVYYGWGLDFYLNPSKSCWVHIPVPTATLLTTFSGISITFTTGRAVWVSQVHVWNGPTKVKEFTGLKWSGHHHQELTIDPTNFNRGLGLSILVTAREDPDAPDSDLNFILHGAGALSKA